jgi:uracil-DNA glycosylase
MQRGGGKRLYNEHIVMVNIDESWKSVLDDEWSKDYFFAIKEKLLSEKKEYDIFPPSHLLFNAYNLTPFDSVKVVIL